jgi:hypothetical protein
VEQLVVRKHLWGKKNRVFINTQPLFFDNMLQLKTLHRQYYHSPETY